MASDWAALAEQAEWIEEQRLGRPRKQDNEISASGSPNGSAGIS